MSSKLVYECYGNNRTKTRLASRGSQREAPLREKGGNKRKIKSATDRKKMVLNNKTGIEFVSSKTTHFDVSWSWKRFHKTIFLRQLDATKYVILLKQTNSFYLFYALLTKYNRHFMMNYI